MRVYLSVFTQNIVVARLPQGDPLVPPSYVGGESCAAEFPGSTTPNTTCTASYVDNLNGSEWNRNLYWGLPPASFPGASKVQRTAFAQWQVRGHDTHGVVANPLFRDASNGDYRVRQDSPAIGLGYPSWDWTVPGAVGPNWSR